MHPDELTQLTEDFGRSLAVMVGGRPDKNSSTVGKGREITLIGIDPNKSLHSLTAQLDGYFGRKGFRPGRHIPDFWIWSYAGDAGQIDVDLSYPCDGKERSALRAKITPI
jgi:hypothetical protein